MYHSACRSHYSQIFQSEAATVLSPHLRGQPRYRFNTVNEATIFIVHRHSPIQQTCLHTVYQYDHVYLNHWKHTF